MTHDVGVGGWMCILCYKSQYFLWKVLGCEQTNNIFLWGRATAYTTTFKFHCFSARLNFKLFSQQYVATELKL